MASRPHSFARLCSQPALMPTRRSNATVASMGGQRLVMRSSGRSGLSGEGRCQDCQCSAIVTAALLQSAFWFARCLGTVVNAEFRPIHSWASSRKRGVLALCHADGQLFSILSLHTVLQFPSAWRQDNISGRGCPHFVSAPRCRCPIRSGYPPRFPRHNLDRSERYLVWSILQHCCRYKPARLRSHRMLKTEGKQMRPCHDDYTCTAK